jgi:hypothetical protein
MAQESTGIIKAPHKILVHGVEGVGKTKWACDAPKPYVLDLERGSNAFNVVRKQGLDSLGDVLEAIGDLYSEPKDIQTVVVDSLDVLEKAIWQTVCSENRVKSIADIDWGRGYTQALSHWKTFLEGIDALRNDRGMTAILIAHTKYERFEDPETTGYDRYEPAIHKTASAHIREWADEVLFATYKVHTREADGKFGKKIAKGLGGERVMRTSYRPAAVAKNRLNLPDEIALDWNVFAQFLNQ